MTQSFNEGDCVMTSVEDEAVMVDAAGVETRPRRRRKVRVEDRANWVALFERSGQGVREFCREHDVAQSSLSAWRRGRGLRSVAGIKPALIKVAVTNAGSTAGVVIRLRAGPQIEAPVGTDVAWLAALSARLDACSA
jgi:transposase-like protein